MDSIDIFLSKLSSSEQLYQETAKKLGCGGINDRESLENALSGWQSPLNIRLFVSNEEMENRAVGEIRDVFEKCSKSRPEISVEVRQDEFLDLVDDKARITLSGKPRTLVHRDGDLHLTVHIWIIKCRDMGVYALLQKRSPQKDIFPDCYDASAAGHVSQGEEYIHAAMKEAGEELGLQLAPNELEFIGYITSSYAEGDIRDNELRAVYIYRGEVDIENLHLQTEEVTEVRWAEIDELLAFMKNCDFPNCISAEELGMVKKAVY